MLFTRLSSSGTIRICGASRSSWRGVAVALLSVPLHMKRESLGCDRRCLLFERNAFAQTLCSLPPDFLRYRAVSRQVREILTRHTDLIEPLSLDEAYLDVSDNKTGLPTATQVARTDSGTDSLRTEFDRIGGRSFE